MKVIFIFALFISFSFSQSTLDAAYSAYKKQNYEEAAELFDDYLDDHETDHKTRFQLAKAYFQLKEYSGASDELEEIIDLGGAKSEHYQFLWQVYIKEGEDSGPFGRMSITGKIFDTTKKLAELEPDSIRFQRHAIFGMLNVPSAFGGNEELGLKKLAELKKWAPYDADQIYFDRLLKQDKIHEATKLLAEIEAAASGRTDHYKLYQWYGQLLMEKDMFKEAIALFQKKTQLMPNIAYYHYELGTAFQAVKDRANAIKAFEAALKIDPKNEDAKDALDDLQN